MIATPRRLGPALLVVTLAAAVLGCVPVASLTPADTIQLTNATTTAVAVHVNGGWAGTYPAGAVTDVPIVGHGGPPFTIEVRSPSGAILSSVTFSADDARGVAAGSGSMSTGGDVGCGWIEIRYGNVQGTLGGAAEPPAPDGGAVQPPAAGVCK